MNPADFKYLAELIKRRSGLALTEDKQYLLESRLKPIARTKGHEDLGGFVGFLRASAPPEALLQEITEAMTTNESMFFRDNKPFMRLKETVIPKISPLIGARELKIWSAACSNGQEPYSLAMMFEEEKAKLGPLRYKITATDLDTQVLKKAKDGFYTQFEVQRGLPIQLLLKYFEQREGNHWQIKEAMKANIAFRQGNLLDKAPVAGKFDIVLCRNVLIYFDENDKRQVLERMAACLEPHGVLFLGSAETVMGVTDKLKPLGGEAGVFVLADSKFPAISAAA